MKRLFLTIAVFVMIASLAFPNVGSVIAAESTEGHTNETTDFLNSIGISAAESDGYISRKDFVVMTVQASGIENYMSEKLFEDTYGDSAPYISTAKQLGYIKGGSDGLFNPDNTIRFDDAMLICLRVLGFEKYADNDLDKNRLTRSLNLLKNLEYSEFLTCNQANIIIFNMLNSHYAESDFSENETLGFSDDYFMNKALDIYEINGTVTAVGGISIEPLKNDLEDDRICIDNVLYKNECGMDYDSIGSDGTYYIKEYDNYEAVVFFFNKDRNVSAKKIRAADIIEVKGFDKNDSKSEKSSPYIQYEGEDLKVKKINLDSQSLVYVNGTGTVNITNETLSPKSGFVKILSSDSHGRDIIIVEDYLYYKVNTVDYENEIISDEGNNPTIFLNKFDKYTVKYSDGKTADLSDIKKNSLLAVLATVKNNGFDYDAKLTIEITNNSFSGKIEGVMLSESKVTVSGKEYKFSDDVSDSIKLKNEGKFYLGKNDEIVFFDADVSDKNYGFLMKSAIDEKLNRKAMAKIYDSVGKKHELSFDEKQKVRYTGMLNDSYVSDKKIDIDTFLLLFGEAQMVVYEANGDTLTHIEKAVDCSKENDYIGYDEDRFTVDYESGNGRIYSVWVAQNYNFKKNARLFVAKKDASDDEDIVVADYSYLGQDAKELNIKLYDSTDKFEVPVALVTVNNMDIKPSGSFVLEKHIAVIQSDFTAFNDDGEEYKGYNAYCRGEAVKLEPKFDDLKDSKSTAWKDITGKTIFSELEPGDIVQYGLDSSGKVNMIHILHSKSSGADEYVTFNDYDYASEMTTAYGKVTQFIPESFFSLSGSEIRKYPFARPIIGQNGVKMYVYEYNRARGTVSVLNGLNYLNIGDEVFVRTARADVTDIVIYR